MKHTLGTATRYAMVTIGGLGTALLSAAFGLMISIEVLSTLVNYSL